MKQRSILALNHEKYTSLGMLNNIAKQNQIPVRYLNTSDGERLSEPITNYSHIIILGGTMSAYEEEQHSFLKYEFQLIETAIAARIPIVGICLGAQILAKVLGAAVYRGEVGREAGWCEVHLQPAAKGDRLLKEFPDQFRVFQSHQDSFDIPLGCVHLAKSDQYPNQAFRYEDFVWAIQFHLEMDECVLRDCSSLLEQDLKGSGIQYITVEGMIKEAERFSPSVQPLADQFMREFLR
jgi:GMP synthase (glutamine-hydrolysing)